ncbi:MAG: cyclic GMP-AMP synthase DncV-like nucleotidyltransferase [Opitutaceae bacterium]
MYNYNKQIQKYESEKVAIGNDVRSMLRNNRKANQERLSKNIPEDKPIQGFQKQGSYAHWTMTQNEGNDYDIDDGVLFNKEDLVTSQGNEMSPLQVRDMIADALTDDKFNKQPERLKNCVRVFYKAGHHVDVPAFRLSEKLLGGEKCEIASSEWRASDPKQINAWFDGKVLDYKKSRDGKGLQFRKMIRLLKRFCRSRQSWNMPSGLILTMLASEKMPNYERDDECFYYLLKAINERLKYEGLRAYNLSDDSLFGPEELTKSADDTDMRSLRDRSGEAIDKLKVLHDADCTQEQARKAWDWVFKTDGFFDDEDGNPDEDNGGSPEGSFGIASSTPKKAVDLQGGGRFG